MIRAAATARAVHAVHGPLNPRQHRTATAMLRIVAADRRAVHCRRRYAGLLMFGVLAFGSVDECTVAISDVSSALLSLLCIVHSYLYAPLPPVVLLGLPGYW